MPDHERGGCSLLLCERKKLRRKIAHHVAVERHIVRGPKTPYRTENSSSGSSGGSPSASACSISKRARSTAALVSGAAYPLTCMSEVMSAT